MKYGNGKVERTGWNMKGDKTTLEGKGLPEDGTEITIKDINADTSPIIAPSTINGLTMKLFFAPI
mgnify:CR=1 FL=1